MKIIVYYCEECGGTIPHPDSGGYPVYRDCLHCGVLVLLWKDKAKLIAYIDHKRLRLSRVLCKLLDVTYEQVKEKGGMHVVMRDVSIT